MPKFRVEQYEVYSVSYVVEAESRAEAIKKVLDCGVEMEDEPRIDYIETSENHGMSTQDLTREEVLVLEDFIDCNSEMIPSIRPCEPIGD